MTKLIYRGVEHAGAKETAVLAQKALMYRGHSHDGTSKPAALSPRTIAMVYRGIRHSWPAGSVTVPTAMPPYANAGAPASATRFADVDLRTARYA